ncbi:MAG: iron-sulfur cluster assembly accessory protein [Armatimonadetes bacterium]|nr:iron-sulfur cluster assembly accessory protein [Armatimonadota bacterium]
MTFPITIDPTAARQIAALVSRKGGEGSFLRVGVKGGGCSGLEYVFRIDDKRLDIDLSTTVDGTEVVCDAKSAAYLEGATLVYTGNMIGGGFAFENPNAERQCGCGTSFTPKRRG